MTGRERVRLAAAALAGGAIALPLGMMLSRDAPSAPAPAAVPAADRRAVFSPRVLSDPYFLDRQREGIEALEARCRETGEFCAEARQARRWLDERAANR